MFCRCLLLVLMLAGAATARADEILLEVEGPPADGLVVAELDLTAAARWCGHTPVEPQGIGAQTADGQSIPFQFVPAADFDPAENVRGTAVFRLGDGSAAQLRLTFGKAATEPASWDGSVQTASATIKHEADRAGGLPSRIEFTRTGKRFENFRWNDRLYHAQAGSLRLADDPQARVERIADGPLCTVVQVRGRYTRPDGTAPPSMPEAAYQWFYFPDRPLIHVTVRQRAGETAGQSAPATSDADAGPREAFVWKEAHFLELNFPGDDFSQWAGGEPSAAGSFQGKAEGTSFSNWAAVSDARNAIGAVRSGPLLVYDGRGGYGNYLHAHRDVAWSSWVGSPRQLAAWLWIGSSDDPAKEVASAADQLPIAGRVTVRLARVRQQIEAVRKAEPGEQPAWWQVPGAEQLEAQGRFEAAIRTAGGQPPAEWTIITAGGLGAILERTGSGLQLSGIFDTETAVRLTTPQPQPLFSLTLRNVQSRQEVPLHADAGWKQVDVRPDESAVEIRWSEPEDARLNGVAVVARSVLDPASDALRWDLRVENGSEGWSVWRVVFPQVAIAEFAADARVLVPKASGEVQQGVWQQSYRFGGTYPSGWTSMQFMAAYAPAARTGLYVAVHDPRGSTKDISAASDPQRQALDLRFDHPAAGMGQARNQFHLGGQAVWQRLRGDWFDACLIYRDWVRREARWYPELGSDGREDTPLWLRELPAWALGGGAAANCVEPVKGFAAALDRPAGFHWYNWHQIPFDNDYPHYFPTKEDFGAGVQRLQQAGVHVMPYINGRLWDTRDRGSKDHLFTSQALPAASKNEQGEPYLESYGSKEADGSAVKLAAMCPTTEVWQNKVREIVLRLMNEYGVHGVYIDQVAAAAPTLCFDASHDHPPGGGHWWTEGYWDLLEKLRRELPEGRILTTECNAEPYLRWFDGYLTWHWQYDGQVPAFSAVYGGAIQLFGRAYRGGPTQALALRMKAGEQLVFGEQIGWIDPAMAGKDETAAFFRQIVQLRWALRRYFYAGEMARPPRLVGDVPRVTADWQWQGEWPVTTDAVRTGAWRLPAEQRLVLLAVNVSEQPVEARLQFDACEYGFEQVRVTEIGSDGPGNSFASGPRLDRPVTFAPGTAYAWELTAP